MVSNEFNLYLENPPFYLNHTIGNGNLGIWGCKENSRRVALVALVGFCTLFFATSADWVSDGGLGTYPSVVAIIVPDSV